LDVRAAELDARETLTSLQANALLAALQVQLAAESVTLARQGTELAEEGLRATEIRFARGAANERELRQAQARTVQARNFVRSAEDQLLFARDNLLNLTGRAIVPATIPELPVPDGIPLSVLRSEINIDRAEVGISRNLRNLYPVARVGYTYNFDGESSLDFSLDSRNLQPEIAYSYNESTQGGGNTVNSVFTVGIGINLPISSIEATAAARDVREAAAEGLRAAQDGANIQLANLSNQLANALRNLQLEELEFANAALELEEDMVRAELGLITPLELQETSNNRTEASNELQQARLDALTRLLNLYEFYGIPVSEVLQ
jgi:outer membrane protein TolC